ncbi:methionine aminopeptidase [Clostridia bacterium]|nr:methionine aminopeptidase [Clostridia bacterium]
MAIIVKSEDELKKMRVACQITGETLGMLGKMIAPGVTTEELDRAAEKFIRARGGVPSFLRYRGFPKSACISVNEEVIHGIPGLRKLKSGDIVSVDIGAFVGGFHGDAARTFAVGEISEEAAKLIEVTRACFFAGAAQALEGNHLHQISEAVQKTAEAAGFSVVREYVGHGVGRDLHEDPSVPNYKPPSRGPRLVRGMTLAIEPMINIGTHEIKILGDKWTVVTKDGSLSAHYENSIAITANEPEIMTLVV